MGHETPDQGVLWRNIERGDQPRVAAALDEWWGGRALSGRLSHVFFVHFRPTSFAVECDGELLGFLLGFVSQTTPSEAYVHFVGVHPDHRRLGLGQRLYARFCAAAGLLGCDTIRSHTSPQNRLSIAFHTGMHFAIEPGDDVIDGVSVWRDYAGPGEHRVRFVRYLGPALPVVQDTSWAALGGSRAALVD